MTSGFDIVHFSIIFPIIFGLTGIVSAFAYKIEEKIGEKASLFLVVFIQTLSFLIMWAIQTPFVLIAFVMVYMSGGFGNLVMEKYIQDNSKSEIRATILSTWSLIRCICVIGAAAIAGPVLDIVPMPDVILWMALIVALAGGWLLERKYY
jgi:predicted MFS family arabinose efflux permease